MFILFSPFLVCRDLGKAEMLIDIFYWEGRWDKVLEIRGRMSPPVCSQQQRLRSAWQVACSQKQDVSREEVTADMVQGENALCLRQNT